MPHQAGRLPQPGTPERSFPERRTRVRHKVHSPAYATKDHSSGFILPHLNEIVDISEDGMCFQNSSQLEAGEILKICLDLSETRAHIEADSEVVWSIESGRTGVRFQKIPKESLHQLRQWLFINNIVACVNHPSSDQIEPESPAVEFAEYTEPLLTEHVLTEHTSALMAVSAIGKEVAALGLDVDAALQLIADRALALTRATGAAIALSGGENMICRASSGFDAPPVGAILQIGSGFSGECVRTGQLLHCEDSETDPRVDKQSCRALGVRSMIAAPVHTNGLILGILEVFSPQVRIFTDSDKDVLQRLAEIVLQVVARSAASSSADLEFAPETEEQDSSRLTRILVASVAVVLIALLALIVVPRVRSKMIDAHASSQTPVPTSTASHTLQTANLPEDLGGLRHLAEQGDTTAQFALGARYAAGEKEKRDYVEAARWFALAADRGDAKAQSVLAAYYWDGTGVPKDLNKAYFWAILARANGDGAAKVRAAELATRISPSERNAIEQQADDWLEEHGSNPLSSASK